MRAVLVGLGMPVRWMTLRFFTFVATLHTPTFFVFDLISFSVSEQQCFRQRAAEADSGFGLGRRFSCNSSPGVGYRAGHASSAKGKRGNPVVDG